MAMQEPTPAARPTAEVVGNAFVEQYYHILHQSPEMVHRFYQDSSLLSRPDVNGAMTKVTTMQVCPQMTETSVFSCCLFTKINCSLKVIAVHPVFVN